jgi:hypothetical protein
LAVTTKEAKLRSRGLTAQPWMAWVLIAVEVLSVYYFGRLGGWWWLAGLIVVAVELWPLLKARTQGRGELAKQFWVRLPGLVVGLSFLTITAVAIRQGTQIGVALLYAGWLIWRLYEPPEMSKRLAHTLFVQAVMFEAIFLAAATWRTLDDRSFQAFAVLLVVWVGSYLTVYGAFTRRGDRTAGLMAATWGVIATEVAWILQLWLVIYTLPGGLVLVPQPALILTALAYVFGSILTASRQGVLSRARLGEYLIIGFILVAIVAVDSLLRGAS